MSFTIDGIVHEAGNKECPACWNGAVYGPCGFCDGNVHAQEYEVHGEPVFIERCDNCGK